jgi:transcriptional regulator with XRE-family HTH domain
MTQQALADAVGVAKNTIARLEQGGITDLRGQAVARVATVLGVSTDYLLGLQDIVEETSTTPTHHATRQRTRKATPVA